MGIWVKPGILAVLACFSAVAQMSDPLRPAGAIPMPGVAGRIDHMRIDIRGQRLFVAALGNNTMEVLDVRAGKELRSVKGLREPQGVFYLSEPDRVFVANGADGSCSVFDGQSLQLLQTVELGEDADNIRYDPADKLLYVGYGQGALGILSAAGAARRGDIRLDGHPESFQLERAGHRIFVNVPGARHVAVIDRRSGRVVSKWPLSGVQANFPMALDEKDHRLFIGCRRPPALLVLDTESGREVARTNLSGDTDDLFYDPARRRIYASCGAGFLDVIGQRSAARYERLVRVPTAPGARTSLFVPELNRLYLAVPRRGARTAEIRIFDVQ